MVFAEASVAAMVRRSSSGPAVEEVELDDRVDVVEDATPGHMHILTLWQDADADPVHKPQRSAGAAPLQRCRAGARFFSDMEPGGFRQKCFVKSALVFVEMSLSVALCFRRPHPRCPTASTVPSFARIVVLPAQVHKDVIFFCLLQKDRQRGNSAKK